MKHRTVPFLRAKLFKKYGLSSLLMFTIISISFAGTIQLPQTGQSKCYDSSGTEINCTGTGQDGEIQAGVVWPSPRFTDNNNGTITDNLTGLIWLKNANCFGARIWANALNDANTLNSGECGLSDGSVEGDWRLPNINELESLINAEEPNTATWLNGQGFLNVQSEYWSSSTCGTGAAWLVGMSGGYVMCNSKTFGFNVWPVRSATTPPAQLWKTGQTTSYATGDDGDLQRGVAWPDPRFTDNGDGTVTDILTGLIWLKNANCFGTRTWSQALTDANTLASGNCGLTDGSSAGDWRLPNRKEMRSLIDYSQYNPALPAGYPFTNVQPLDYFLYWSSSTRADGTAFAWWVYIYDGLVSTQGKTLYNYVWPVRGGLIAPPQLIEPNAVLTNQSFDEVLLKTYTFTLFEGAIVAILSAGPLDLKGVIKDENGSVIVANSGYKDIGSCQCIGNSQVENGHDQNNFMLRAELGPGNYIVEVRPENEAVSTQGEFAIIFLKRPSNSEELFAGLDALLDDEDTSNNYLDIYVKALYPEYYDTVEDLESNSNYGSTICFKGICRERQCKALPNFYLSNVLEEPILLGDKDIIKNWLNFEDLNNDCIADYDYVLRGDGDLIYHGSQQFGSRRCGRGKYCYDPATGNVLRGEACNVNNFVIRGDIFVQRLRSYNHYGLIYDGTIVIDANVMFDGRLRREANDTNGRNTERWKVARPR